MSIPDNWGKIILVIGVIVLLAFGVYYGKEPVNRLISDVIEKEEAQASQEDRLIIEEVDFIRKDEQNRNLWNLKAEKVIQQKDSKQYDFQIVDVVFNETDDFFSEVNSKIGIYYNKRHHFVFSDEVTGVSSRGMTLECDFLEYNTDSKEAVAHKNVKVIEKESVSTGKLLRFFGDPKNFRSFELIGDVNVVMEVKSEDDTKK